MISKSSTPGALQIVSQKLTGDRGRGQETAHRAGAHGRVIVRNEPARSAKSPCP